jgi:hypothetical protein
LSFVLERHVETLITEPISMDLGFGQVVKVNLLNLFGIDPGQQCRNLANQVRLPSAPRIIAKPEGDSVPSVLTARHIEVRAPRTTALGASRATVRRVFGQSGDLTGSQSSAVA